MKKGSEIKMVIEIIKATSKEDLEICSYLRKEVFGKEEHAPEALCIIDELDRDKDTKNYILKVDGVPVASVRFIKIDESTIKLQRLIVLKEHRHKGYARLILEFLEKDAYSLGYKKIVMDSAQKAVGFYKKYDYKCVSEVFYEDGRPHIKMEKELNNIK